MTTVLLLPPAPPPRKKGSSGKPKAPMSNGSVAHGGGIPLTNGTHSNKSVLNGNGVEEELDDSALPDGSIEVNGHLSGKEHLRY